MPPRSQTPQPILPQVARPATIQPLAGNAFALPANFTLKPHGSGKPLPESVQKKMESFFNTSFADVRIHVGHEAPSIGALAFTHGSDLYFAPGQYNPQSTQGQQLLGHELTHVVQQRAGRVTNPLGSGVAVVQDTTLEAEADRMGMHAASHTVVVQAKMSTPGYQAAVSVIQMRCPECGGGSGHATHCSRYRAPTPTVAAPRRTTPSTLGTSHTRFRNGHAVGHGRRAAEGGHTSDRRARMLRTALANSQAGGGGT